MRPFMLTMLTVLLLMLCGGCTNSLTPAQNARLFIGDAREIALVAGVRDDAEPYLIAAEAVIDARESGQPADVEAITAVIEDETARVVVRAVLETMRDEPNLTRVLLAVADAAAFELADEIKDPQQRAAAVALYRRAKARLELSLEPPEPSPVLIEPAEPEPPPS